MSHAHLITCEQLAIRLSQPDLLVLDCRFSLDDPDYGRRAYSAGHVPGAQFLDLNRDLSAAVIPGQTGRHPLPDPRRLARHLASIGLSADTQIVVYDDGPGAYAARAWWLLAWLGKREGVSLLDGGLKAWTEWGGLLTSDVPLMSPGDFEMDLDDSLVVEASELHRRLNDPHQRLLDARSLPRYLGHEEPIDPIAGHIPGAVCAPFTDNLQPDGRFKSPEALSDQFAGLTGECSDVVAYCGSGVTACHNVFAMSLAGLPMPRLYAGSWSEWITDSTRPVATATSHDGQP
ncbi:sulfurtransferase [Pseudomonas sp. Marseille-QA0892]